MFTTVPPIGLMRAASGILACDSNWKTRSENRTLTLDTRDGFEECQPPLNRQPFNRRVLYRRHTVLCRDATS